MDWRQQVFEKYRLMWVQRFFGDSQCKPPACDSLDCASRSIGMWQDKNGKGYCLCAKHSQESDIERPIKDIGYRPTEYPKAS